MKKHTTLHKTLKKAWNFPSFMAIFSSIGLLASVILSAEKTHILQNPEAELLCDINPIYSCQSVALSDQASIFGFSNELIGIAFFGGMLALALGLLAGAQYKKWLHVLAWLGLAGSMGMVVWFFYQSVYVINALCVYCSLVWFATWSLFVGYSRWLLKEKIVALPKQLQFIQKALFEYPVVIWFTLVILFATLILNHFWYYYGQYFS
jgi:uncharacterized membrane protein